MTKSLGQINYERFHAAQRAIFAQAWVTPLVPWHEVPVQEQQRWQAAAEAVMHEVIHGVQWDYMPPQVRAVLEAARDLERLVTEWRDKEATNRRAVFAIGEHFAAADTYECCADDLEAVLRRTALEEVEK